MGYFYSGSSSTAGSSIMIIAITVILFLIVFAIVMAVAGPAQNDRKSSKKRDDRSGEPNNLPVDDFEYGFETAAPSQNYAASGNRSPAHRQEAQSNANLEYGFDDAASTTYVRPQPAVQRQQPAPQNRASSPSSYRGENFVVDKLGYGGSCRLCRSNVNQLYRFTLIEDGERESENLCAKCCKKLIAKIENG